MITKTEPPMTLQQLRAFLAVVEHGSFRAAARALSVSQAGLTQRVQELEATLGRALLLRSARGASLTDAGLRLRERALLIDAEARLALEDAPTGGGHDEGTLRIGVGPTPTALLLPRVVPDFHARFPGVRLRLMSGLHERLRPALLQGSLDMALMAVPDEAHWPDLHCTPLFRSALTVVGRKGHPLAGARQLERLQQAEWILMGTPGGPGGTAIQLFNDHGRPSPRVAATCESFTEVAALLATTDWLALLPAEIVRSGLIGPHVAPIAIREQAPRYDNCLVQRQGAPVTPAAAAFATMCRSWSRVVARG
ncbi:LysR substrate-binding domain-containing protein [Hydrogenophaga sp.]|uniref:LysR substrate-binding domain-containing protein n=1 Tax=Hydrogenophaga sp. TaxID=1904254 RepID=UPI0026190B95|nr:LysR substrate-binding domain-containing protein [Hydrogenophaga sp.]